ncbi:Cytosolic Fe-S cluster assembly factor nar1 [Pleurotus pulmonarius]|nr:Cytosolic Fe-S cluster assembly factor nar1 [Pleurotus pulmonarius]KAF4599879.1 Cytosolic Fe-S cluster assembly factor nar1 [Pleurotus pulmonarius]
MAFSGALTLTDLNDFITPSQACIKPVEQTNRSQTPDAAAASTEIRIDSSGGYHEVAVNGFDRTEPARTERKLEQAQINLNDCLACSGCITSAESVLITLQSHVEVLNVLANNTGQVPVISIAPQSLASLAASISTPSSTPITPRQVLRRIRAFCLNVLGFSHVFDTTFARHMALQEHIREFLERKKDAKLPMLASACPGWICYAEKTHAEMLPFIASTKSPQQIMGTLVKNWMGMKWKKLPHEIYHVSVMPCYDKKLEASRQDFYNDVYSTRDVDCVITTGELEIMMREKNFDLTEFVPGELDHHPDSFEDAYFPELITHPGSSSGSYLQAILDYIRQTSPVPLTLSVQTMRNVDYEEYILRKSNEEIVFKGAKCYGFRNLQNVVRKVGKESGVRVGSGAAGRLAGPRRGAALRRGVKGNATNSGGQDSRYDYVEVMACPGGCVNGGGQLKSRYSPRVPTGGERDAEGFPRDWTESGVATSSTSSNIDPTSGLAAKWGDKEWTRQVEASYWLGADSALSLSTSGLEPCVPNPPDHDRLSSSSTPNLKPAQLRRYYQGANMLSRRVLLDLCYQLPPGPRHTAADAGATLNGFLKNADDSWIQDRRAGAGADDRPCDYAHLPIDFDWTFHDVDTKDGMMGCLVEWHGNKVAEETRKRHFRTQYRAVESEVIGLAVKW